jgi:hypothetical protein
LEATAHDHAQDQPPFLIDPVNRTVKLIRRLAVSYLT